LNLLVLVLSSQLLYYLLIAQTGVVGAFDSHIHDLYTLPIGGIIGSLLSAYGRHSALKRELYFLFGGQIVISWFYPEYSLSMLLALGFLVGYTTPLLLYIFTSQSKGRIALGLAISYAVGTALYTYPFDARGGIALLFPLISMGALYFTPLEFTLYGEKKSFNWLTLALMMLWIFADSALFETLSRSGDMDIWSRYTLLIITAHLAGVYLAYRYGKELMNQTRIILSLFLLSYTFYWLKEPIVLAVIYPIVISYYNVLLFQALIRLADIRLIGLSMIGVGWIATSIANAIALEHQLWMATIVLGAIALMVPFYFRRIS
jgi:beta-carotene 15,15'-dioxygenase